MGYCFRLNAYDPTGNFIDAFEYAGTYGAITVYEFLNLLRELCLKVWSPLPEDALWFIDEDVEYDFVDSAEILECLEDLDAGLSNGDVKFDNETHTRFLKEFISIFKKAVDVQGYIRQTLH